MVQGFAVEALVMTAVVGWMVAKTDLRVLVAEGTVTLGFMEVKRVDIDVEFGSSSVMVTLLQDLQQMRW